MSNINNEIQVFNNANFGQVRSLMINGEPWFVGKDVAEALGYSNTRDVLTKYVDDEDKNTVAIHDGKGNPNHIIINESGLYSLIMSSKLPKAKEFKRWVTSEVLPTIRKTGSYGKLKELSAPQTLDSLFNIDTLYLIVSKLKEEHDGLKAQITEKDTTNSKIKPERYFSKNKDGYYTTSNIANRYGMNAQGLNKILEKKGIQYKDININKWRLNYNYKNKGYEYIRTYNNHESSTMLWTDKGLEFIVNIMAKLGYNMMYIRHALLPLLKQLFGERYEASRQEPLPDYMKY